MSQHLGFFLFSAKWVSSHFFEGFAGFQLCHPNEVYDELINSQLETFTFSSKLKVERPCCRKRKECLNLDIDFSKFNECESTRMSLLTKMEDIVHTELEMNLSSRESSKENIVPEVEIAIKKNKKRKEMSQEEADKALAIQLSNSERPMSTRRNRKVSYTENSDE